MKHEVGKELDWEAPTTAVTLCIELPFWIMVPDCTIDVEVNSHIFKVEIREGYIEQYIGSIDGSRANCVYFGPSIIDQSRERYARYPQLTKKDSRQIVNRKCKTVLRIHSDCNKDVLIARKQEGARGSSASIFLNGFCMAHIEVINQLIQHYRHSTYDSFAYEISPWDVPVWFLKSEIISGYIGLLNYAMWDEKPTTTCERYKLIDETQLQFAMAMQPSAGEFELLDALNFMERGDYSGAIRRITTAIEAQTESVLRQELLKIYSCTEVEVKLEALKNDFPGRLRQYEKLSKRKLSYSLNSELDVTRDLRHLLP